MNTAATDYDGINKYIRITDIDETSHLYLENNAVSPLDKPDEKFLVNENDILFARTGASVGKSYKYSVLDGNLYFAGFLIRVNINKANCNFIFNQTLSKKYEKWVNMVSMRSGQPGINAEEYKTMPISLTEIKEQEKISSFLLLLDEKIQKQQQLVELLKKYKKGLSNEFFKKIHADNLNEKIKFSDVYEIVQNNTFSRELLTTTPSKISNIHYGDILTKYNSVLDIQSTLIPFIKENVDVSKFSNSSYLREGDIIFADTAEDYTVGKAIEIIKVKGEKILSGLHTIPCRPKRNLVKGYMGHYFNSKEYRIQILPLIQGTKVSSISKSELMKTQIVLPSTKEQRLITNCLSLYDNKIFIEEKIIEELKKLEASLLQQLFI